MLCGRTLFVIVLAMALMVVSSASGEAINGYTATASPPAVKPSTLTSYTIELTNTSPSRSADRAKIGIPVGFIVSAASVHASTGASAACVPSTWVADPLLIAEGKINLKSPPGGPDGRLCPGGTLTVDFSATSPAGDLSDEWKTELLRGDEDVFVLDGPQPAVRVDGTAPVVTITSYPDGLTNVPSGSFEFSANESASFECNLDVAPFVACNSPIDYKNLADGSHTFTVRATDGAGNIGQATYTWKISTGGPTVAIMQKPADPTKSRSASFSFAASGPATFQCSLDNSAFAVCPLPRVYTDLADGRHRFVVRGIDALGNLGPDAVYAWTIDATPPQTTLAAKPPARTTATSARLTFSASEPATFQCRLDGRSFLRCSSPKKYAGLARGPHRFAVRAIDAAGNVDSTPSLSKWTVGRRVPRVVAGSALIAPAAGARVTRPPLLRWRMVPGARYYNVQLYRAGRKVLTTWPTRPSLQVKAQWRLNGQVHRFEPGTYRWYVWPGYGQPSARRYGSLLGTSTFVVGPATRRP